MVNICRTVSLKNIHGCLNFQSTTVSPTDISVMEDGTVGLEKMRLTVHTILALICLNVNSAPYASIPKIFVIKQLIVH